MARPGRPTRRADKHREAVRIRHADVRNPDEVISRRDAEPAEKDFPTARSAPPRDSGAACQRCRAELESRQARQERQEYFLSSRAWRLGVKPVRGLNARTGSISRLDAELAENNPPYDLPSAGPAPLRDSSSARHRYWTELESRQAREERQEYFLSSRSWRLGVKTVRRTNSGMGLISRRDAEPAERCFPSARSAPLRDSVSARHECHAILATSRASRLRERQYSAAGARI